MASFDIVSKVEVQTLDNAINTVKKEIGTRFDFKDAHVEIDLNKKDYKLNLEVESDMQLKQVIDVLISRSIKQGLDANCFDFSKEHYASGKYVRKEITVRNGLAQDDAKKVVKIIKDAGLKVQAAIMGDTVRVTGKKIDDLQEVIQLLRGSELNLPLQFTNMKS
jgi:uncharacterized protein YajQ (UPF0234 family)